MSIGQSRSYAGDMMERLTPVVKALLVLNLGIYFTDLLILDHAIREFGAFTIRSAIHEGRFWEFLTFQFIHGSVGHVLFNSIGLFFFGPWMERWWGWKSFLLFYLVCGAGGAGFFMLLTFVGVLPQYGFSSGLVGASAGIYGILVGVAMIAPSMRVSLLIPPVTLTMRQFALILMAFAVGSIAFKIGGNEGGEAGHLGGAVVGAVLVFFWGPSGPFGKDGIFRKQSKGPRRNITPKIRPRTKIDLRSSSEVDVILDKISREGFQSLTDEERDVLQRAAKPEQD